MHTHTQQITSTYLKCTHLEVQQAYQNDTLPPLVVIPVVELLPMEGSERMEWR